MSRNPVSRNITGLSTAVAAAALVALAVVGGAEPTGAQDGSYSPEFTSDKQLKIPEGKIWREWPYVGSLVTPNSLNGGQGAEHCECSRSFPYRHCPLL